MESQNSTSENEEIRKVSSWFFEVLKPEPQLRVSEWADKYRYLSSKASAEPGRWRTSRTPYLEEPMNALSVSDPCQEVVLMFGAQLGKTEGGNNWAGYVIDQAPAPMLMVQPTVDIAKSYSSQRIAPMINDSPALKDKVIVNKSRDEKNTILCKEYPGGMLMLAGSNSAAGLRSKPIKYLFLDEIDAYPQDVDGEGCPIELAKARTRTFARRKMLFTSTPTDKETSRIEKMFLDTDQRRFHVECPACKETDHLKWSNFVIPKDENGAMDWRSPYMVCEKCGNIIEEWQKTELLASGKWVASCPEKSDKHRKGYHMNALYSPLGWFSWQDIAKKWVESIGNPLKVKEFINTVLAETWENKGERMDTPTLMLRCEDIDERHLPFGCHMVTCGIDVQADRIELEFVGWGRGEETWSLGYEILSGDPTLDAVWQLLDLALSRTWVHHSGVTIRAYRSFIDSGNGSHMSRIYEYVAAREGLEIYACKGSSDYRSPVCSDKSYQKRSNIYIYLVGTIATKDLFYGRVKIPTAGPGYVHIPKGRRAEWFEQITSEEAVIVKGVKSYRKIRARNEALDCRVYAIAAMYSIRMKIDDIAEIIEGNTGIGLGTPQNSERIVREIEN